MNSDKRADADPKQMLIDAALTARMTAHFKGDKTINVAFADGFTKREQREAYESVGLIINKFDADGFVLRW